MSVLALPTVTKSLERRIQKKKKKYAKREEPTSKKSRRGIKNIKIKQCSLTNDEIDFPLIKFMIINFCSRKPGSLCPMKRLKGWNLKGQQS